ncbi:MAG: hypothetical protein JW767_07320 [Thermoleophilia bacterium]|nr:hypothetical protein [Thermoleophilia bacterium]
MKTRIVSPALIAVSLFAALAAACLLSGCGEAATADEAATASPSPAPAWLVEEAAAQAERLGDPSPEAAFWRYEPLHDTYTIVLVGEFDTAHSIRSGVLLGPGGVSELTVAPSRWALFTYTADRQVNVFGCGPHEADGLARPGLQPLEP